MAATHVCSTDTQPALSDKSIHDDRNARHADAKTENAIDPIAC